MWIFTAASSFVSLYPKTTAVVTVTGVGLLVLKKWIAGGVCRSKARLDGKTVLITGANTGFGKEAAVDVARRGVRVILICRDMDRANKAAEDVRKRSGNGNVIVKKLDLASLQSVRQLAKDILASEERLDVLINNAGVITNTKSQAEDGFEMQFGVNHLGHLLLANCLLDLPKKSAPSCIVNVSSLMHERGQIYFDDIHLEKRYHPMKSYYQSKLATGQQTARYRYCLHPGVIRIELGRHLWPSIPLWKTVVYALILPGEREWTLLWKSVDGSFIITGSAVHTTIGDCAPSAPRGLDDEAAKKLWDLSASMVGLT